jgi:hypothetical protein
MKVNWLLVLILVLLVPLHSVSQASAGKEDKVKQADTLHKKKRDKPEPLLPYHKNVFKFNPTTNILWEQQNFTFQYERLVNRKQSFTISLGRLTFPSIAGDTILNLLAITDRRKQGINFSTEYRFYLYRLNKRPAPAGVYFAPFYSFYGYKFTDDVNIMKLEADSLGQIGGNFWAHSVGLEIGFQFVFWKRFTVDFVCFGPCIAYYGGGLNISGNLDLTQLQELHEELYDKLIEKFPTLSNAFVDETFRKEGTLDLITIGLRYSISIGFHF